MNRQRNDSLQLGYLIPEFPGQTHVWIWREIEQLRALGCKVELFSTRPPSKADRASHAFGSAPSGQPLFLASPGCIRKVAQLIYSVLWALLTRPLALVRCLLQAFSLRVESSRLSTLSLVPSSCRFARHALKRRIDHVHCHTCGMGAIVAMLGKTLGAPPYSMTLNAHIDWWGGAMAEKTRCAEFTTATSHWLFNQLVHRHPELLPKRALLLPVGVDTQRWRPDVCVVSSGSNARTRLVSVGRLHAGKGHDILLSAVAQLVGEGFDLELEVLGNGPQRDALVARAAQLRLTERVTFSGSASEEQVMQALADADVFVLASRAEALGVAYMEAMAMEVATIGTETGGVPEIIEHGVNGLLVPSGDDKALATAIRQFITDPGLRRRLGKTARRTVVERYDSRRSAERLYEWFIAAAGRSG